MTQHTDSTRVAVIALEQEGEQASQAQIAVVVFGDGELPNRINEVVDVVIRVQKGVAFYEKNRHGLSGVVVPTEVQEAVNVLSLHFFAGGCTATPTEL